MKLTATLYGDQQDEAFERGNDVEIEFDDVKEITIDAGFFVVIKNTGDRHATRIHTIKKYTLTN